MNIAFTNITDGIKSVLFKQVKLYFFYESIYLKYFETNYQRYSVIICTNGIIII